MIKKILMLLTGLFFGHLVTINLATPKPEPAIQAEVNTARERVIEKTAQTPIPEESLPPQLARKSLLSLPFYSQAPLGNWDALHEEACGEASLLMVHYWRTGERPTLAAYDEQLKKFINWQTSRGYGVNLSAQQIQAVASKYLSLTLRVMTVRTMADIAAELEKGNPVIFPADGKRLQNPFFSNGGSVYHMLVIIAREGEDYLTNDPGTKRGSHYHYRAEILNNALGNWSGDRVGRRDRRVLVFDQ